MTQRIMIGRYIQWHDLPRVEQMGYLITNHLQSHPTVGQHGALCYWLCGCKEPLTAKLSKHDGEPKWAWE